MVLSIVTTLDNLYGLVGYRVGQEPFGSFPPSEPYVTVSRHTAQALQSYLPLGIPAHCIRNGLYDTGQQSSPVSGGRTSQSCDCRHLLSLPRKILQTISQWSTGIGRGLPFGPGNVSTRIRPITGRHSLLPASYSRTPNNVPYGFACSSVPERKYGVSTCRVSDD